MDANKSFATPAPAREKSQTDMKQFKGVASVGVILNIVTESSQIFNNARLRARKFLWCTSKILSTFVVCGGHDQVTDSHLLDVRRSIANGAIVHLLVGPPMRASAWFSGWFIHNATCDIKLVRALYRSLGRIQCVSHAQRWRSSADQTLGVPI